MRSELVRRVMDNIASKNIDTIPRKSSGDIRDDYEYQKQISLSNYNSTNDLNNNSNNGVEKKAINLNSLADKVRGSVKNEAVPAISSEKDIKAGRDKRITLSQLSKLSGAKGEGSATYKSLENSAGKNNKRSKGLSLEDLANNIKKNI